MMTIVTVGNTATRLSRAARRPRTVSDGPSGRARHHVPGMGKPPAASVTRPPSRPGRGAAPISHRVPRHPWVDQPTDRTAVVQTGVPGAADPTASPDPTAPRRASAPLDMSAPFKVPAPLQASVPLDGSAPPDASDRHVPAPGSPRPAPAVTSQAGNSRQQSGREGSDRGGSGRGVTASASPLRTLLSEPSPVRPFGPCPDPRVRGGPPYPPGGRPLPEVTVRMALRPPSRPCSCRTTLTPWRTCDIPAPLSQRGSTERRHPHGHRPSQTAALPAPAPMGLPTPAKDGD